MIGGVEFGVPFDKLYILIIQRSNYVLNTFMSAANFFAEFHAEKKIDLV